MRIPYGLSNFADLRRGGYLYADKTGFIPNLEDATKGRHYLIFLRPPRMGKTLLLSMLEHYYDVLAAPQFDALFGGLAIAAAPTEMRGRYAVLRLEMTGITAGEGIDTLRARLHARLHQNFQDFLTRYREIMPKAVAAFDQLASTDAPALLMSRFIHAMQESPIKLYVLIDDYDDFAKDLIAVGDHESSRAALRASGCVRKLYEVLKQGTALGVVGRIFMTGVSPVTLDDFSGGFDIASNVSLDEDLNTLAGFTSEDVERIVAGVVAEGDYTLDPASVVNDLRRLYGGYLFSRDASERMFNPGMVLFFLKGMAPPAQYPEEILDGDVRTDQGRIRRLLFTPEGAARANLIETLQDVVTEASIHGRIQRAFFFDSLHEDGSFLSLLYYLGLLTLHMEDGWPRLRIPNYAVRNRYWRTIARLLQDLHHVDVDTNRVVDALEAMSAGGDVGPSCDSSSRR
jgi:Predicted AAA-ATPase